MWGRRGQREQVPLELILRRVLKFEGIRGSGCRKSVKSRMLGSRYRRHEVKNTESDLPRRNVNRMKYSCSRSLF